MYISKVSGGKVYETFEELLDADVEFLALYEENYYFRIKSDNHYNHAMWKVDQKTKEVSYFDLVDFLVDIQDKAELIDIEELRRANI